MSERPAVCQVIIDAAGELGVEYRRDVNNLPPGAGDSIGWCQQTRGGRRRASAAQTYLARALPLISLTSRRAQSEMAMDYPAGLGSGGAGHERVLRTSQGQHPLRLSVF
jgi:hypothetical protein